MTDDTQSTAEARQARKQRRRDRNREEILDAARSVLLRDGIGSVTLEAVAREAGMSKTGLYYYFTSKEALIFQLVFGILENQARRVHDSVSREETGPAAIAAIIRSTVQDFASQMEDFRLAYLHGQVSGSSGLEISQEHLERIRPLNEMLFGGAASKLSENPEYNFIDPRLFAFLAFASSLGVLTMKGLVELQGDPLRYSDDQLIDALSKIFAAAADQRPSG